MNPTEAGFDAIPYDVTEDLLVAGMFVGASLLATFLVGRFLLRRFRETIPWPFLRVYYGVATPTFLLLLVMSAQLADHPIFRWLPAILLPLIGLSQIPLLPILLIGHMLPVEISNPWVCTALVIPLGYLVGRGFVFLLYWLAWSDDRVALNLDGQT
jgi:hypothetical protein